MDAEGPGLDHRSPQSHPKPEDVTEDAYGAWPFLMLGPILGNKGNDGVTDGGWPLPLTFPTGEENAKFGQPHLRQGEELRGDP